MGKRHQKLGIKQTIQKPWMDKSVQMLLAGLSEKDIRAELDQYLSTQKQSGGTCKRGKKTYGMAVSLLAAWFSPDDELKEFRDAALNQAKRMSETEWLPLHWALFSATYPFWFNVAKQVGRLLNLQNQITRAQIFNRLKEQYGDRETVTRNARYAMRSFVTWGVLKDSAGKGNYEKSSLVVIAEPDLAILMLESALLAISEAKMELGLLLQHPAFFPFKLPVMTGNYLTQHSDRIEVVRYGLDAELLKLKGN